MLSACGRGFNGAAIIARDFVANFIPRLDVGDAPRAQQIIQFPLHSVKIYQCLLHTLGISNLIAVTHFLHTYGAFLFTELLKHSCLFICMQHREMYAHNKYFKLFAENVSNFFSENFYRCFDTIRRFKNVSHLVSVSSFFLSLFFCI